MALGQFALVFGIVYLLVAVLGFVPGIVSNPGGVDYGPGGGNLLGLFPVNYLHDAVHAVIGVWGIAVRNSPFRARSFARTIAIAYALLGIIGLLPGNEAWIGKFVPLGSFDIALHLVSAAAAAYFGFGPPSQDVAPERATV